MLCLTYLRHVLGFFSSLHFIFTALCIILMLYQLALHVVVKSLLIFSLLISHCFFCFFKITRYRYSSVSLYFTNQSFSLLLFLPVVATNTMIVKAYTNLKQNQYIFVTVRMILSQMRYSLVVILELNGGSEVQYKDMMMVDDRKYQ